MFDLGAFLMMLSQKPEMAPQLDALGIPAFDPSKMKLGGPTDELGGLMGPKESETPPVPGVQSPGTTQVPLEEANPAKLGMGKQMALAALKGIVPPTTPQPIMNGGVTGGVKPPQPLPVGKGPPGAIQALMAAMGGGGRGVPDLGSLIRR